MKDRVGDWHSDRIYFHSTESGGFLFSRECGDVYLLNGTGAFVYQLIVDGTPLPRIVDKLRDKYEVEMETAAEDVSAFLDELRKMGLAGL